MIIQATLFIWIKKCNIHIEISTHFFLNMFFFGGAGGEDG